MKLRLYFIIFLQIFSYSVIQAQPEQESYKGCPDLTVVVTMLPNTVMGISPIKIDVAVRELTGFPTDSSTITVRIPNDPRITFPIPNLPNWDYNSNFAVHNFVYNKGIFPANGAELITIYTSYDPNGSSGRTSLTATVIPLSGGECKIINNSDAELLVYFQ